MVSSFIKTTQEYDCFTNASSGGHLWREFGVGKQGPNQFKRYSCIHGTALTPREGACRIFSSSMITRQSPQHPLNLHGRGCCSVGMGNTSVRHPPFLIPEIDDIPPKKEALGHQPLTCIAHPAEAEMHTNGVIGSVAEPEPA